MNIIDIIGKKVLSIYEGTTVGTSSQIIFNNCNTKVNKIKLFDDEENEYYIFFKDIYALSDNILIKNNSKLVPIIDADFSNTPLFKQVVSQKGKDLGKIVDAKIDELGNIEFFYTDKNEKLMPQNIKLSNFFCIYFDSVIKISNFKPRKNLATLNSVNQESIKVKILQLPPKEQTIIAPKKVTFNPLNLVGKRAKSSLFGQNSEVIIKADQVITEKTIAEAKRHARLNQLYFLAN